MVQLDPSPRQNFEAAVLKSAISWVEKMLIRDEE